MIQPIKPSVVQHNITVTFNLQGLTPLISVLRNILLKENQIMAAIDDIRSLLDTITTNQAALLATLDSVDTQLDTVLEYIKGLRANTVTPAQLEEIKSRLTGVIETNAQAHAKAEAIGTETGALDDE